MSATVEQVREMAEQVGADIPSEDAALQAAIDRAEADLANALGRVGPDGYEWTVDGDELTEFQEARLAQAVALQALWRCGVREADGLQHDGTTSVTVRDATFRFSDAPDLSRDALVALADLGLLRRCGTAPA